MELNRILSAGGIALVAAFAMETSAQASFAVTDASVAIPEPVSFLVVGLALAVLPLIRKNRN